MRSVLKYNNENGFALILALSMLAIMSILGAFVLMTSTTEVQISSNYNANQQSLSAADRAVEYAINRIRTADANINQVNLNSVETINGVVVDHPANLQVGVSGLNTEFSNRLFAVSCGAAPVGSGTEMNEVSFRYYSIQVAGSAQGRTNTRVDSQVARLVAQCN